MQHSTARGRLERCAGRLGGARLPTHVQCTTRAAADTRAIDQNPSRTGLEVKMRAHIAGGDHQARGALVAVEVGARACKGGWAFC